MDQVLYDLMDWAGIEEIVYSEAANPERLLGAHEVEEGLLIQVFMPHAVAVAAKVGNESYLSHGAAGRGRILCGAPAWEEDEQISSGDYLR